MTPTQIVSAAVLAVVLGGLALEAIEYAMVFSYFNVRYAVRTLVFSVVLVLCGYGLRG